MKPSIWNAVSDKSCCSLRVTGLTLIELLVTLSIAMILLTLAVPSFNAMLQSSRLSASVNTYVGNLQFARSEATKRNARVALCKSADGLICTTSNDWSQGWLVFHDVNNNAQVNTGEDVLRVHAAIPNSLIFKGNNPVANYVSYTSMGGARFISGAFQAGTLTLCRSSSSSGEARNIVISATGRPRVETVNVATCP
jgi:type IV fimbrial biogenesis protein FimT